MTMEAVLEALNSDLMDIKSRKKPVFLGFFGPNNSITYHLNYFRRFSINL